MGINATPDIASFLIVFALGLLVSFFSGLLGIGGGIIMTPLLLYVPQLFGVAPMGIKEVAGLTMVQGLFGALSGLARHRGYGFVSKRLVMDMGLTIAVASFLGAIASQFAPPSFLLVVFGILAVAAAILMLFPVKGNEDEKASLNLDYNRSLAMVMAGAVGILGGLVGQGGAFILLPLMIQVLRIPTRIAIGSSLGIVLLSAAAGFLGKLGTGQIHFPYAVALVLGAFPGAQVGAFVSRKVKPVRLRQVLAVLISLTAMRIWWGLIG